MALLEGTVFCHPAMQRGNSRVIAALTINSVAKPSRLTSQFYSSTLRCPSVFGFGSNNLPTVRGSRAARCNCSPSSDGKGSMAGNFDENDNEYLDSTVIEAVELRSSSGGFVIKMRDGRNLRCVHNTPQGNLPDYAPHPAIVLKIEDGSDLLLPIVVLELPSVLLMSAMRNVKHERPTIYQVVNEMIDKMGYVVKLVRLTERIDAAYVARLFLTKAENERDSICLDVRPSDAINVAVRCKVPIQVNRNIAYSDGMRVIEPTKLSVQAAPSDGLLFTELDRPDGEYCEETKEFILIQNMQKAAAEERYKDAALWRDQLVQLRSKKGK